MPIIIDHPSGLPVPRRTDRAPRSRRQGRVPGPGDVAQIDAQVLRDPGLHATPADFGAGIGQSVEAFGAAASRVASDFAEMRRDAEDATAGAAALAEARVRFVKVAQGLEDRVTSGEGFADALDKALLVETDDIFTNLRDVRGLHPSERGKRDILLRLAGYRARVVATRVILDHQVRLSQFDLELNRTIGAYAMAAYDRPADYLGILAEMEESLAGFKGKLPPAKVAAARGMIAASAAAGLIEFDPGLAQKELKAGLFDDDLSPADRKRLRARAGAAQRDRRAQAERGQARDRATAGADGARRLVVLEGAIERGEAGEQAIAEAADILDDPTRARLHGKLDARRAEDAARSRRIEKVSAVLAGRAPATGNGDGKPDGDGEDLRPGALEWRQAVDDHYASLGDALETMDPEPRARFEDDYARTTGVLPEAIAKTLRAGLLSADPAAQVAAAARLARLEDADPGLVSAIPADERRRAQAIAEFADLGLPPHRAVELAEARPAGVGEDDQPVGGAGDDALAAGGPGDDTPDKDVTEDELIERIAALSEEVLDLAETGRQEAEAEDEPLVMANVKAFLTILKSLGKLLGRKPGQEATREGAKRAVGKMVEQLARKAGRRIQRKILGERRGSGKGVGKQRKGRDTGGLAKDIVPVATEVVSAAVRAKLQKRSEERARAGRKGSVKKIDLEPSDFEPGATAAGAIQGLVEAQQRGAIRSNEPAVQLNLDKVDDTWAARVKKDTARLSRQVDVSGLRHAIDTIQISKAFKKHGPGNEKHPNQIPISPEAVAVYLDVVINYDAIIDVRPKAGATNITFEKAVDGVVVVVEQARTEQNTLSFFNMWIRGK